MISPACYQVSEGEWQHAITLLFYAFIFSSVMAGFVGHTLGSGLEWLLWRFYKALRRAIRRRNARVLDECCRVEHIELSSEKLR